MTNHPRSRGPETLPLAVRPRLGTPSPWSCPINKTTVVTIPGYNIPVGSTTQVNGVDSTAAQWLSPTKVVLTVTGYASPTHLTVTVISPDGLVSNPTALDVVP
jgi:hypothetical protein